MEKIADNFYMITLPMPFRLQHVHVFALIHNGKVALFDTGVNTPETLAKLEHSLDSIGKTPRDIDRIYITHFPVRTTCGIAGRLKEISGAAIAMSDTDRKRIHSDQEKGLINQVKTFYRKQGLTDKLINSLMELLAYFRKATIPFPFQCR